MGKRIPEGHRHDAMQAFRQVLNAAVRWKVLDENPARHVPNPLPKRDEIRPFESWEQVEAVADELGPFGPLVIFAAGTGLRPRNGSRSSGATSTGGPRFTVRRAFASREVRDHGKTNAHDAACRYASGLDALDEVPPRLDTPLVFAAHRGGHLNLHNWRARDWKPAIRAGGIKPERRIYDLRHTYATSASPPACRCSRSPAGWARAST